MAPLAHLFASIGVLALFAVQLSCEDSAYHPDEIQAKKTFQAIANGITEADLIKQLGEPTGRIVLNPTRGTFQYFRSNNPTFVKEFRTLDEVKDSSHTELRFLRVSAQVNTIVVFVKGTVYGYFYLGGTGHLEDKVVVVS